VTAATDGRAGVRNLANRCVRWRVGRRWYLIAMLGMPIAMTLATTAIFGAPLLNNLFNLVFETFVLIFARVVIIWLYNSTSRSIEWLGSCSRADPFKQHGRWNRNAAS
jgi:hypothetical protein